MPPTPPKSANNSADIYPARSATPQGVPALDSRVQEGKESIIAARDGSDVVFRRKTKLFRNHFELSEGKIDCRAPIKTFAWVDK
jgi:hypothetical protein